MYIAYFFFLGVVLSCKEGGRGHLHNESNLYKEADNIHWDNSVACIVEDLRTNISRLPEQRSTSQHVEMERSDSFRAENFQGMEFAAASRERGRPPRKKRVTFNPPCPPSSIEDNEEGKVYKKYQLCGDGGICSPTATPHRLQNPN